MMVALRLPQSYKTGIHYDEANDQSKKVNADLEKELLLAMSQGDESAFDKLFHQWYPPLCAYASRLNQGNLQEAEDIVQHTFVKIWEKRVSLKITLSFKAYLYRAVHNSFLNIKRSEKVRSKYQDYHAQQVENRMTQADETSHELKDKIQGALEALPPQCRHIFELSRFETLKYREIAEHLGISIKTVEAQMGKALRTMRIHLSDYLISALILLTLKENVISLFSNSVAEPFFHLLKNIC